MHFIQNHPWATAIVIYIILFYGLMYWVTKTAPLDENED
jgi:hypothetical protein